MRKSPIFKISVIGAFALLLTGCQTDSLSENVEVIDSASFTSQSIPGMYIVVYNNSNSKISNLQKPKSLVEYKSQMNTLKATFVNEFKFIGLKEDKIKNTYGHSIKGFSASLTEAQAEALRNDSRVASVEQDFTIKKGRPGGGGGGSSEQVTPYGTSRVGGGGEPSGNTAWVIDSGIDLDHLDLNVDVGRSISFLTGSPSNLSPDDQNGHGTHVAGTIGAKDNGFGSVGVAPGNLVVAVRVLDRRGSGSTSGVIAGVDYVAANASSGDVANMSLGGGVSSALDNAVIAAAGGVEGIIFVLAAGNESDDADNHSPARAEGNNIYTISAMDSSDNWASFSNYGSAVDYCAPGVAIYSTWKGGGYNTISGTSMAAPHAAGVLLFGAPPLSDGFVTGDRDNNPDPIIHK